MEVAVDANANSTTGGIGKEVPNLSLQSGDILSIFCDQEDKWDLLTGDSSFNTDANGLSNHPVTIGAEDQTFRGGAMVGSFNNGATFFSIGLFTQITVLEGGSSPTLRLYCADSDSDNNNGFIKAIVKKSN